MFRDKILICADCGNQFVYTVGQQRQALDEQGDSSEPSFCPVCAVKRERGRTPLRPSPNGHHPGANGSVPAMAATQEPPDDEWQREVKPPSPNRPDGYHSGEAHPLHGHGGEAFTGTVKWFNDRKGFGFITLDNGVEIFVHYSGIASEGYRTLKQAQRVSVTVEDTPKGPQAGAVRPLPEAPDPPAPSTDNE